MSFFEKIVFKTFLILALICFCVSSAFADKTYTYYSNNASTVCNLDKSTVCAAIPAQKYSSECQTSAPQCDPNNDSGVMTQNTCPQSPPNPPVIRWAFEPNKIQTKTKVCKDGEKFELNGCEAKCVVDPCKALIGLQFTKSDVQCGTASCPSGSVFEVSGTQAYCKPGAAFASPRAAQTAVDPATLCSGTLANAPLSGFKIKTASAVGKSSSTLYCTATYTNSGSSSLLTPDETGLGSLSFMDVTETTEDSPCPPNTTKGSYAIGENGETKWICYPDSGSPPTDPTDPPPINCAVGTHYDATTDKCVPDTTPPTDPIDPNSQTCPTGQHKDVSGNCVSDTTGGGGGGGGLGGSGGNPPNIDDTKGAEGSGSQTGAGGKATASTAEGCGTPPSCDGDPLQCAAFVQDWKQNCQMMSITQGDADKANALSKSSNDEHKAQKTVQEQKVSGFFSDFKNTANASLSSGQCPNDVSLSVMGKQMTLKFADSCFFWRLLRALVIVSAYLAAASIVFRSLA